MSSFSPLQATTGPVRRRCPCRRQTGATSRNVPLRGGGAGRGTEWKYHLRRVSQPSRPTGEVGHQTPPTRADWTHGRYVQIVHPPVVPQGRPPPRDKVRLVRLVGVELERVLEQSPDPTPRRAAAAALEGRRVEALLRSARRVLLDPFVVAIFCRPGPVVPAGRLSWLHSVGSRGGSGGGSAGAPGQRVNRPHGGGPTGGPNRVSAQIHSGWLRVCKPYYFPGFKDLVY